MLHALHAAFDIAARTCQLSNQRAEEHRPTQGCVAPLSFSFSLFSNPRVTGGAHDEVRSQHAIGVIEAYWLQ